MHRRRERCGQDMRDPAADAEFVRERAGAPHGMMRRFGEIGGDENGASLGHGGVGALMRIRL